MGYIYIIQYVFVVGNQEKHIIVILGSYKGLCAPRPRCGRVKGGCCPFLADQCGCTPLARAWPAGEGAGYGPPPLFGSRVPG